MEGIPEAITMLSHNDLTLGDSRVKKDILSVGILRITNFDLPISFLNLTSASSKIATKSSQGVTRPPLVRADCPSCLTRWNISYYAVTLAVLYFLG